MTSYRSIQNVLSLSVAALLAALAVSVQLRPASAAMDGVEPIEVEGKGWSPMRLPPIRLPDGRIVIAWNNSLKPGHVMNRLVLAAAISDDEGQTWRGYREIARVDRVSGKGKRIEGPGHGPTYPWLVQATDGAVLASYHFVHGTAGRKFLLRLDPDWLEETTFRDDFSQGLENWITMGTEGPQIVAHPDQPNRRVLRLHKPKMDKAAGASLNFPFGVQGKLAMKLQLRAGSFHGARMCLTDHFTWPHYAEDGRFGIRIGADGEISLGKGKNQFAATGVKLEVSKWHTLGFAWDCQKKTCKLTVDGQQVGELPQLSKAVGVCYLRMLCIAEDVDLAGLDVDWVNVRAKP